MRYLQAITLTLLGLTPMVFSQTNSGSWSSESQAKLREVLQPASGAAVMIAGELWDTFQPPNRGPWYGEANQPLTSAFLRIGNFDRIWSTPTHSWPGGWPYAQFWAKGMFLSEFNPDSAWNPPTIGGQVNPAYRSVAGGNYAIAAYHTSVVGADDPNRNYARETRWVDPAKRQHAIYQAGWPTNIGVDVEITIHQFTLNWNNFNDFILVEIKLKNTGKVDINADGIVERENNKIHALTLMAHGETFISCFLGRSGGRSASRFGAQRAIGYVADDDPKGFPWDMVVAFPGESTPNAKDMGLNDYVLRHYTDVWSGWAWVAAKKGAGPSEQLHLLMDKPTIYGTHPIGLGPERGWYATGGHGRGLGVGAGAYTNPKLVHTTSMGVWYKDGGRSRSSTKLDLSPNPNFFDAGTPGDPTSFIPKPVVSRRPPNGDLKSSAHEVTYYTLEVNPYEPVWTKGFSAQNNFDGDLFSGIGPFSLEVGDTMTIVWAEASGYRFQGVANAVSAARWAFENGYRIPEPPAVPEMKVENTLRKSVKVRWDNRPETHPEFAGYKVYKAAQAKPVNWLTGGMRTIDEYWRNTIPELTPATLKKPVNPEFRAFTFVEGRTGSGESWGPYELVAIIPKEQRTTYIDQSVTGFHYSWEDRTVDLGFKYWYYVAAYTAGSYDLGAAYAGYNSPVTNTIETSNLNRNGATGLWEDTYPFADLNSFYPKDPDGRKKIGAGFVVASAVSDPRALRRGEAKISVKPNPYKRASFFDNILDPFDHKVMFYNLPPKATITILDVSGQIIQQIDFRSDDPDNGSVFWNMFSKNGIEVASGLYIYVVDYEGGQHVGYFSILR